MSDITTIGCASVPGVVLVEYVPFEDVERFVHVIGAKMMVVLKSGASWTAIRGSRYSYSGEYQGRYGHEIRVSLPKWELSGVHISELVKGRYVVRMTDRSGKRWLVGAHIPLHLKQEEEAPDTATRPQGITLTFYNNSVYPRREYSE